MTDCWVSQPKHFCKFCKCWTADNKPSRDFHEKGKRHQENVERKITEVRKLAVTKEKKEEEENSYMIEMEMNAKKAFMKDIKKNPALAAEIRKKKQPTKQQEKKADSKEAASGKAASNEDIDTWHVAFSEEGYPYYWNKVTAEVTWAKPKGYVEKTSESEIEIPKGYNIPEASSSTDDTVSQEQETIAQSEPQLEPPPPEVDACSAIPLPTKDIPLPGSSTVTKQPKQAETVVKHKEATKRAHGAAYGSWEQIKEEEHVDLELPEQDPAVEQQVIVVSEPKIKFKEKKIDSLGADLIAFKKRKQANRNLKQRVTDR